VLTDVLSVTPLKGKDLLSNFSIFMALFLASSIENTSWMATHSWMEYFSMLMYFEIY